jgi:hypothetical protein
MRLHKLSVVYCSKVDLKDVRTKGDTFDPPLQIAPWGLNYAEITNSDVVRCHKKRTPQLVAEVPYFPIEKENNTRTSFLEIDDYQKILAELPPSCRSKVRMSPYGKVKRSS